MNAPFVTTPNDESPAPQRPNDSGASRSRNSDRLPWRRPTLVLAILSAICGSMVVLMISRRHAQVESNDRPPAVDLTEAADGVRESILSASDAVLQSPQSAATWGRLGMVFFAHQLDAEAAICFQHAVNRDASEFRWSYLLALVLTASEHDRAIELLRECLALRPDVAIAHARLGELLIDDGELEDAAWHLQRAVRLTPADPRPHLGLARVALLNGQLQQAQESAVTATQLAPDSRSAFEVLARTLARSGQKELADSALRTSETLREEPLSWRDPYAEEVLLLRSDTFELIASAEQLFAAGRTADAISQLHRNLPSSSADPQLTLKLAEMYLATGQVSRARELLSAATLQYPRNASGHFLNGVAFVMSDQLDEAVACFDSALQLKPDFALARYNLGQVCLRQNRDAEALEQFRTATRLDPMMSDARINVAKLLLKAGDTASAKSEFQTTLRHDPSNVEAAELLQGLNR